MVNLTRVNINKSCSDHPAVTLEVREAGANGRARGAAPDHPAFPLRDRRGRERRGRRLQPRPVPLGLPVAEEFPVLGGARAPPLPPYSPRPLANCRRCHRSG